MWRTFAILTFLFFFFANQASSVVIINEVSPRTDPEWVELYNPDSTPVDVSSFKLVDKAGNIELLNSVATISAESYAVFTRPKGWLNDSSEEYLYLYDPSLPDPIDSMAYTSISEGLTIARLPSITGLWYLNQSPTMGYANPGLSPSPTPSSSVEPSPSPSLTPSSSPSIPPSATIIVSPSPSPSPTKTPVPSVASLSPSPSTVPVLAESDQVGTVAGSAVEIDLTSYGNATTSPTTDPITSPTNGISLNHSRLKSLILIILGLICLGVGSYFGLKYYKTNHLDS